MNHMKSSMEKEIKEKLKNEMKGTSLDIKVDVKDGFVSLWGIVDTLAVKRAVEEIVTTIRGVKGIDNDITISTDGTLSDKEVEAEVIKKMRESEFSHRLLGVGVEVSKGIAILEGHVETLRDKKLAINQAEKALGVKDVVPNVKIDTAGKFDDVSIANKLTQMLSTTDISMPDIDMAVNRGVVMLHGHVNDRDQMELAVEIAQEIEGVTKVQNKLLLR